jgi:hypothetical protein
MEMSLMFVDVFIWVVLCCHLQTKRLILYLYRQSGGGGGGVFMATDMQRFSLNFLQ